MINEKLKRAIPAEIISEVSLPDSRLFKVRLNDKTYEIAVPDGLSEEEIVKAIVREIPFKEVVLAKLAGKKAIINKIDEFTRCAEVTVYEDGERNIVVTDDGIEHVGLSLQKRVEKLTDDYIAKKIAELDEDLVDLTSELALYLTKPELTEYEAQRKQFIEKVIAWKEQVWVIEEQIEAEIDEMGEESLRDFEQNMLKIVEQRYEGELREIFEEVKSLQV